MSKFDDFLDEYVQNNPLPKNKAALKEFVKNVSSQFRSQAGKKNPKPRNLSSEEATQMSQKAVEARSKMKKN